MTDEINPVSMGPHDGRARTEFDQVRAERAVTELLLAIGEDPERDGLRDTPKRVAKLYKCVECSTEFKGEGKYCSSECYDFGRRKYKTKEELAEATRKKVREVSANYRASVKNQTPPDADRKAIREFYDNCPIGYEVDHIIPISKGGLHTLSNLQYLTITENRRKSNKIIV